MSAEALGRLQGRLGHAFADHVLLVQSLTHRSFGAPHNERLEFLGDATLNFVIAELLFQKFRGFPEGDLSRLRAGLVNQQSLADIAIELELGELLRLGEGELKSGGFRRPSILADALEAIIGAIHLDAGFDAARSAVTRLYASRLGNLEAKAPAKDPKTTLQELLQARHLDLPAYSVQRIEGEAHQQLFHVECEIPALRITTSGSGASRKMAEQDAAAKAAAKVANV